MAGDMIFERELSFSRLTVRLERLGGDWAVLLSGGHSPHIGCTVLAVPRPSLTDDGSTSVTSSVLNVTGHKDECLCRFLAETVCRKKNAVTVCCGGFHEDGITEAQIREVIKAVEEIGRSV